jgi:hypothetical protein
MAAEVSTHDVDPADPKNNMLNLLADGKPWLFLTADHDGPGLAMSVETGGGVRDINMIRNMLTLTLDALPDGDE